MAYLHMTVWDFLDHTPIEIDYALKAYYEHISMQNNVAWEIARTQTYFQYLYVPSRKRKVSYNNFKKEYFNLEFDKNEETQPLTEEQILSMQKLIKEKTGKREST